MDNIFQKETVSTRRQYHPIGKYFTRQTCHQQIQNVINHDKKKTI